MDFILSNLAVFELAHQGGGAQGHFVQAIAAIDHQRMVSAQALQSTHLNTHQVGVEHAHQNVGRTGGVGQRPQNVEQGSHAELFPNGRHVFHGGVMVGRKHKPNAHFSNALGNLRGRQVDIDPQALQHIGAAAFAAHAAAAVLADLGACGSHHEHRAR